MYLNNFLKKYIFKILITGICGLLATILFLYIPIANKNIIDNGIESNDRNKLLLFILLYFITVVAAELFTAIKQIIITYIESLYSLYLRQMLHLKIRKLKNLDQFTNGQLISHHISDVNLAKQKLRRYFDNIINLLILISIFIFVSYINIKFSFIVILIFPIYAIFPKILGKRITKQSLIIQNNLELITESLTNSYNISKEIRVYQKENWDYKRVDEKFRLNVSPVVKLEVLNNLFIMGRIFYSIFLSIIFYFGAVMVQEDSISLGTLFALTSYMAYISGPINSLVFNYGYMKSINASESRIKNVLYSKERKNGNLVFKNKESFNIVFSNVSLKIADKLILDNISLNINTGEFICITGRSGSGKTSILNLLTKLFNPSNGEIFINNTEINLINDKEYYHIVKSVFQESRFIKGTLLENMFLDLNNLSKIEFMNKLLVEFDLDFLYNNPNYEIEYDGKNLSGGQKQRLALIRALLYDSPILLLDEVTSAIDKSMSRNIILRIKEMRKDKITILVTHDTDLLSYADKILELNSCKIRYCELVDPGSNKMIDKTEIIV